MNNNQDPWANQGNDPWANPQGADNSAPQNDPNAGMTSDPWSSGGNANWDSAPVNGGAAPVGRGDPNKVRTALILGIVGFVFAFIGTYIWAFGPLMLVFGIVGLACGGAGIALAAKNLRARKGMGIPALVLSILAVVWGLSVTISGIACTMFWCATLIDVVG